MHPDHQNEKIEPQAEESAAQEPPVQEHAAHEGPIREPAENVARPPAPKNGRKAEE
jgi:hypothetical protein